MRPRSTTTSGFVQPHGNQARHPGLPWRRHRPGPGARHRRVPHSAPLHRQDANPTTKSSACAHALGAPPPTRATIRKPSTTSSASSTAPSSPPTPCSSKIPTWSARSRSSSANKIIRRRVRRQPGHAPARQGAGEPRISRSSATRAADLFDIEKSILRHLLGEQGEQLQQSARAGRSSWPTT